MKCNNLWNMDINIKWITLLFLCMVGISCSVALDGVCTEGSCNNNGLCTNGTGPTHTCDCSDDYIGANCSAVFSLSLVTTSPVVAELDETVFLIVMLNAPEDVTDTTVVANSMPTTNDGNQYTYTINNVDFSHVGSYVFNASVTFEGTIYFTTNTIELDYVLTVDISSAMAGTNHFKVGASDATLSASVSTSGNFENVAVNVQVPGGSNMEITSSDTMTGTRFYTYNIRSSGITEEDAGSYKIIATETFGDESRSKEVDFTVEVESPTSIPVIAEASAGVVNSFTMVIGQAVSLTCTATGIPEPLITWVHNGVDVSTDTSHGVYQVNGALRFKITTTFVDRGIYTCKAVNTLSSTEETITETTDVDVTVEGKPVLVTSPVAPDQKEAIEISCVFDAVPPPDILWTWPGSEDLSTMGLFSNSTAADSSLSYQTSSTLSIEHSSLCLGPKNITCSATNTRGTADGSIQINQGNYDLFKNKYFIFTNEVLNFDDAQQKCIGHGGTLATLADTETQNAVTAFADSFSLAGFYIGARHDGTNWKWIDDTPFNEANAPWESAPPTTGCAYNVNDNGNSVWRAQACSDARIYACQVIASKAPSNLQVTPDACIGSDASVTWQADDYFKQTIEIKKTSDSSIQTNNLDANINSTGYNTLEPGTVYIAKVLTGYDVCEKHPYDELEFTTAFAKAAQVMDLTAVLSDDESTCQVTWNYPEDRKMELSNFTITVNEFENGKTDSSSTSDGITAATVFTYGITASSNSYYVVKIKAQSCIGNGDFSSTGALCNTSTAVPANIPNITTTITTSPDTSQGIPITISEILTRNGPIQCVYVVARWRKNETPFPPFTINENLFNGIKKQGDEVNENEDYFAFAVSNRNQDKILGIGGQMTTCSNSRRRRAIDSLNTYIASNRALTDAWYQFYLITATNGNNGFIFANSQWSTSVQVNAVQTPVNVAAIVAPIIVILILLILLVLFLLWRNKRKKDINSASTANAHSNPAFADNIVIYENARDRSIAVENLRSTYQTKHSDEDRLFREEYRALATEVSELSIHFNYATALEVRDKNRFSNIHPANESRVVLRRQGTDIYSDYINSSYLDGYRQPRKFIASQGPLPNTMGDFWYMVWEQESTVIVMLTNTEESGRKKCEKYWPDDLEQSTFENLIVKSISSVAYGSIVKRTLQVTNPNQSEKVLTVEQFHFVAWPDHGVPITTSSLFNLRRLVLESQGNNPSPIIVHCSAGVGRTGAFIALDILSNQMERERKVDIYGTVLAMRKKRREMVQTVEQYSLLHKLMLEKYLYGTTDVTNADFQRSHGSGYQDLNAMDEGFFNLSMVPPMTTSRHFPETETSKVRDAEVVPYQHCKVIIRLRPSEERVRYINASYVQTYNASDAFIACQGPVEASIEDFWRVVLDNNVTAVVMLSKLMENGKEQCAQYWPQSCENPCTFGEIIVSLQSETKMNGYTERWMQVSERVLHLRRSLSVMQLHYERWPDSSVPSETSDLLDLIARTQASRKTSHGKTDPVLVHCRDGAGRTGTFCAIVNLIERLKNEDRIDVLRTVKDLRDMRPLMVRSLDQYRFCFKAVEEYLNSFDLYANFRVEDE